MQTPKVNLKNMLNAISAVNHVLNETVTFYSSAKTYCPDCQFDPIRKESTDPNCETCDGTGYVVEVLQYEIPASVEQQEDFKYDFTNAGRIVNGQIFVTVDIKEIKEVFNPLDKYNLNDYKQIKEMIEAYDYIKWQNGKYSVSSFEPSYLQGNLIEIGFVLSLME